MNKSLKFFLTVGLIVCFSYPVSSFAGKYARPEPAGPKKNLIVVHSTFRPFTENLPDDVTVLTVNRLQKQGKNSLSAALTGVAGLYLPEASSSGGATSLFLNGTAGNQTLVLLDGLPLNDPSTPGNSFSFGVNSLTGLQKIEILRGALSGLYGSGAAGGVINLIPKTGQGPAHGTFFIAGGTQKTLRNGFNLGGSLGFFHYAVSYSSAQTQGFPPLAPRLATYTPLTDPARSTAGSLHLTYFFPAGTSLSFLFYGSALSYTYPTLGTFIENTPAQFARVKTFLGKTTLQQNWLHNRAVTVFSVGHTENIRNYQLFRSDLTPTASSSRYTGSVTALAWKNTFFLPGDTLFSHNLVMLNGEYLLSRASSDGSFGQSPAEASHFALSGVLQTVLWHFFTLTGNLRETVFSDFGQDVTGTIGLIFRPPGKFSARSGLRKIFISYGTAFTAPSLFERFARTSYGYIGNPDLKPERTQSLQAGVILFLPQHLMPTDPTLKISGFDTLTKNLITTIFSPVFTSVNTGLTRSLGINTGLSLLPCRYLHLAFNESRLLTENLQTGQPLLRHPQNIASAVIGLFPCPRLSLETSLFYIGPFQDYLYQNSGRAGNTGTAPGGLWVNMALTYRLHPNLSFFANADNLTNSRFEPVNGLVISGRSILAGLRISFRA